MIRQIATTSAIAGTAALLVGCAASQVGTTPIVPESLRAPANQFFSMMRQAPSFKIFDCKTNCRSAVSFEWIVKAPEADLYDGVGKRNGKHYAGPTWQP